MGRPRKYNQLSNYSENVRRKLVPFACPLCGDVLLPKVYELHCSENHGFISTLCCVWCKGKTSWKKGKKSENALHLLDCFRQFMAPYEIAASLANKSAKAAATRTKKFTSTTTPRVIDVHKKLCPGRKFFDHDRGYIEGKLPKEALELFSLLPLETTTQPLLYTDENLNLAVSCMRKYFETRDTHDWIHLMVKAVAFESFLKAMREDGGESYLGLLPFSCWCDGGPYLEARHRQHRHMVIAVPKGGRFEERVWDRVDLADKKDRPCKNYLAKGSRPIVGPMHLLNTLGYMSKRKSRCNFTLRKDKNQPLVEKHFHIFTTLPVQYRLPLAVLWDEGLRKLMYQQHFQNVSLEEVLRRPLDMGAGSQWRQKIDDFYDLPRGLVLPLARKLVPAAAAAASTECSLYLLEGRMLHFERLPDEEEQQQQQQHSDDEDDDEEDAWLERQAEGGNCFYEAVASDWWIPRERDQKVLNLVMPREYKIREQNLEIGRLKRKIEEQDEREKKRLKLDNDELKKENEQLKQEREKCTCRKNTNNDKTLFPIPNVTFNNYNTK